MSGSPWVVLGFYSFALMAVLPGIGILLSKNIIHAAFWLLGSLMGFAGLYLVIGADFLAFTQVLVYMGGILVLILFGVMLTHKDPILLRRTKQHGTWIPAAIAGVLILAGTLYMALATGWSVKEVAPAPTTATIGGLLMTKFILPFEVVSVLLLAALVGAAYIARAKEAPE